MKDFLIIAGIVAAGILAGIFYVYPTYFAPKPYVPPAPVENQYTITAADNGKTFSYPVTSRFSVFLDKTQYPQKDLLCEPSGIIGSISNIAPPPSPELFSARFETLAPGRCVLSDGNFSVTILSKPLSQ